MSDVNDSRESKNFKELKRIEISALKYFWSSSVLVGRKVKNIPKFLREIEVFKHFSENELRILSKFLHLRDFVAEEMIVKKGDKGIGFYLIYSGEVKVFNEEEENLGGAYLDEGDYFGELALLQDLNIRSASIIAKSKVSLLGLLKPDLEDLISTHPKVAAKLIQSLSIIVSNRLNSAVEEVIFLRKKLHDIERN